MSFATIAHAQNWKPAPSPLTTPWTDKVDPSNPLPDYPRPQLVREKWQNLNGLWDYAITPKDSINPKDASQPTEWQGKILVPFAVESSLSGVGKTVGKDQRLWYRRTFTSSDLKSGERLLLHFDAVDWQTYVYVNGRQVAFHEGGYDPFTADITDVLKQGENEVVVAVWDPTDADAQPRGKQVAKPESIWYTAVTGIWQTVWLETVPKTYIESIKLTPDVDAGELLLLVRLNSSDAQQIEVAASDAGKEVARISGSSGDTIHLKIPNAKLWSPDSPFLYDLKITLKQNGQTSDQVSSYFAMRKVSFGKDSAGYNRLMLNNQPIFHLGPLDQGWWPDGLYTAPTDDALKFDIEMTRKMGLNMCRKHIKVEPLRWYFWADKLGLMVWQDMPFGARSGFDPHWVRPKASEDATFLPIESDRYSRELRAMIDHLHNCPSIVAWVPFNEGWGQHSTNEVLKWAKAYDPSRLLDGPSGWEDRGYGDMHDMHKYPGPGMFAVSADRATVLGEFGGLGLPLEGHTWQDQKNWGYRTYQSKDELLENYTSIFKRLAPLVSQGLAAAVYTQTTDVEGEVNGYLTYDRKVVKMDVERLKSLHDAIYGAMMTPKKATTILATSEDQPQQYRYTTDKPAEDWASESFDDAKWKSSPGAFGTKKDNEAARTDWQTTDIWLRRTFEYSGDGLIEPQLRIFHDEDAEIYLNGKLVGSYKSYTRDYVEEPLGDEFKAAVRNGKNIIAVHCHQTVGGQGIDLGIFDLKPIATP